MDKHREVFLFKGRPELLWDDVRVTYGGIVCGDAGRLWGGEACDVTIVLNMHVDCASASLYYHVACDGVSTYAIDGDPGNRINVYRKPDQMIRLELLEFSPLGLKVSYALDCL
jgi:hypothetical protein